MARFRVLSAVEQVGEHLRAELIRGRWSGAMPGAGRLAQELGIRRSTVEAALHQLELDGLLVGQGSRRRRLINLPGELEVPSMRVAILRFVVSDPTVQVISEMKHLLTEAGHTPFYPDRTLEDLGMDVKQVARFVAKTRADAWVIVAGSREVLEWFASQTQPAFALFGRRHRVKIASVGPESTPIIAAIARRLTELGHRRIVMLSRRERRLPEPAQFERAFLAELGVHACPVGAYNLPDWDGSKRGFHRILKSLFQLTPPTALIVLEVPQLVAVLGFLGKQGIRVPEDVSLIVTDPDQSFSWCEPPMAHITWDVGMAARRVVGWAGNVSRGRPDRRRTSIPAKFVEGGTIGPARE